MHYAKWDSYQLPTRISAYTCCTFQCLCLIILLGYNNEDFLSVNFFVHVIAYMYSIRKHPHGYVYPIECCKQKSLAYANTYTYTCVVTGRSYPQVRSHALPHDGVLVCSSRNRSGFRIAIKALPIPSLRTFLRTRIDHTSSRNRGRDLVILPQLRKHVYFGIRVSEHRRLVSQRFDKSSGLTIL